MDIFQEVSAWYERYDGEKKTIGKSVLNREIYAVKIGKVSPVGIAQYAIHGREWITTKIAFYHAERGVGKGSVWLIPLVNPDGALLSQKGICSVKEKKKADFLRAINHSDCFSLWKANANGVDLNVNFPADWGNGAKNVFFPSSENYVGKTPLSEPETIALKRFTEKISPDFTVSYHTKGEEIYWYYYQSLYACARDKKMAICLSETTGYPIKQAKGSVGGYKDWCIKALKIPAFTIEAGSDEYPHPLNETHLSEILERNKDALAALVNAYPKGRR